MTPLSSRLSRDGLSNDHVIEASFIVLSTSGLGVQDIAYGYKYDGLVETLAQGDEIAGAMAGKRLFFHRNHGVILGVDNVARVQLLT